jgi:hypothetical protein
VSIWLEARRGTLGLDAFDVQVYGYVIPTLDEQIAVDGRGSYRRVCFEFAIELATIPEMKP